MKINTRWIAAYSAFAIIALALLAGVASMQQSGGSLETHKLGNSTYLVVAAPVSDKDVQNVKSQGAEVLEVPAGTTVYVTEAGSDMAARSSAGSADRNLLIFKPDGTIATGTYGGPGISSVSEGSAFAFIGNAGQTFLVIKSGVQGSNLGTYVVFK